MAYGKAYYMTKPICNARGGLVSKPYEYCTSGHPITDRRSLGMYKLMGVDIDRVLRIGTPLGDVDMIRHGLIIGDTRG